MRNGLSLGAKFNLLMLAVFLVGTILIWVLVSSVARKQAQEDVSSKAAILLQATQGVRRYTADDLNRYLLALQEQSHSFLPETVPAFSARAVFDRFKSAGYQQFFYKEAGSNPTNVKDDKADTFEEGVLNAFRKDPTLKTISDYREDFGGERRFFTAEPLRLTDANCLRCHSTPDAAPAAMIQAYGDKNGFDWHLGDVIATRIVYVPAGHVAGIASRSALTATGLFALVFACAIGAINLLLRNGVIQPLKHLATAAQVISREGGDASTDDGLSHSEAGQAIEKTRGRGDELGILAQRFSVMADEVHKRERGLRQAKAQVQQRESYFRALIEHASVAYLIIDARHTIRYASPLVSRTLGLDANELVGKSMLQLVPSDHQRSLFAAVERAEASAGTSTPFVFDPIAGAAGERRHIEAVVTNLLDQPAVKGLVIVLRDVTARERLERLGEEPRLAATPAPAPAPLPAPPPQLPIEQPPALVARELDAADLAGGLIERFPELAVAEQQAIVLRLMAAGLTAAASSGPAKPLPAAGVALLRTKLQMAETETVDAGRLIELAVLLADFATALDTLVWSTWKTLAPQSEIRRGPAGSGNLRKVFGDYIGAEGTTPKGQVSYDLERTRALMAALIASLGQVAQEFARRYRAQFSPLEIEKRTGVVGGGLFGGKDARCWRTYKELANELSEEKLEAEVMQGLTQYAESLLKGLK